MTQNEYSFIKLGAELGKIKCAYFYADLIKFVKGEVTETGGMYFCELKPLFDKYGYKVVNDALIKLDKEVKTDE